MLLKMALAIVFAASGVRAAGENAKEFRDICVLYQLLSSKPVKHKSANAETSSPQQQMRAVQSNIILLNLTTIPDDVEAILSATGKDSEWEQVSQKTPQKTYFKDQKQFDDMKSNYKTLIGETKKQFREDNGIPLPSAARQNLRSAMTQLANKAQTVETAFEAANQQETKLRRQAKKHMLAALYGEAATQAISETEDPDADFKPDLSKSFPWTGDNTRDTECKKPTTASTGAGRALAADAICLCTKSARTTHDACLTTGDIGSDNMNGATSKTTLATLWGKITQQCDKIVPPGTSDLSAAALTTAAAAYFSAGGGNWVRAMGGNLEATATPETRQNIIGRYVIKESQPPKCTSATYTDSTQSTGICIDYTELLKDSKGITWVTEISKAAATLEKIATTSAEQMALLYKAETVESQMEALLSLRSLTQTKAPATLTQTTLTAADCNNHKTNKTCSENKCKWEEKDGKGECKPKDGDGQTNPAGTGTEGGAAGEQKKEEKCKGKSQTDCKDGCKWEGTECKDSSILATKKFALSVVSAAFVALLF
uniref:Variant surface glycoprotein 1125.1 n=1 Tax=Trypanosoma brucei TaxID=5691 RepID=A0A1J0R407_9TRYP|nr:variant surface glycoprotein 1125.1 [Trypanosoma brucei]